MAPKKKARRVESVPDVTVSEQDAPGFPVRHAHHDLPLHAVVFLSYQHVHMRCTAIQQ